MRELCVSGGAGVGKHAGLFVYNDDGDLIISSLPVEFCIREWKECMRDHVICRSLKNRAGEGSFEGTSKGEPSGEP